MNLFTNTEEDSYFNKNLDNIRKGWEGEDLVRSFLKKQGIKYMQADLLFKNKDQWGGQGPWAAPQNSKKYPSWAWGSYGVPWGGHGTPDFYVD